MLSILLFGIENFKNILKNLIIINGLGDLNMESGEYFGTIEKSSNTCKIIDTHKKKHMLASN